MRIAVFSLRVKMLGFILTLIMFASPLAFPVMVYASGRPTFEGERGALQFDAKDWRFTLSGPLSNYLSNYTFEPKPLSSLQDLSLTLGSAFAGAQVQTQTLRHNVTFTSNVRVTRDIFFYENEPSIAANPLNSNNLVVATHQYAIRWAVFVAAYASEDGGDSWEGPILLPMAKADDFLAADPGAASSPDGVFYISYLSLGFRVITVGERPVWILGSDIVVASSVDGGKSWVTTIASTPEKMKFDIPWHYWISRVLLDKPYIAAGPPKTVVISYTEFVYGFNLLEGRPFLNITIKAVVSRDGGLTWSEPLKVSPTVDYYADGRVLQGPYPAVGPDGTVYVAYYDSGTDGWLAGSAFIAVSRLALDSSEFTEPVIVAEIPYEVDYYSPYLGFRWWSLMFPVPVASKDAIYIVYAGALKPSGMPKVFITKSTDGGLTWSQPKFVSPEGGAQFFPWVTVGPDGAVHVIWGDTRNDPSNFCYDIYYSVSKDGGETFSEPVRVTDYTSNPLFGIWGFIGDYFNVVATKDNVHIVWTDTRRGLARIGGFIWRGVDQSIFTSKIGVRPQPQIEIEPSTLEAGQAWVITIKGSNLPREAPLLLGFDGVSMGVLAFTDSEGKVEVKLLTPASREGVVKVTLHDFSTLNIIAESALKVVNTAFATLKATVENNSAKVITAIDKLGLKVNESVKALSDEIAVFKREITGKVEVVTSTVNEIKGGLIRFKEDFETAAKALGTTLEGVQTSLKNVGVTVNSINAAIPDLARKGDIDSAKSSLEEAIGEAKNVAASSSRNWGVANALLTVIVLAVLAYQVYTARKS